MTIYEAIGVFYIVLASSIFTAFLAVLVAIGMEDIRRRYWRGKNEEFHDLTEQYQLREMTRTGH
jgi:hypothetical protein